MNTTNNYRAKISGLGKCIKGRVVTNHDLAGMINTSDEWIRQRSGIEQRYWVENNESATDLGLIAANEAIKNAGIDKSQIDMIIFATLSPDHFFPGNACFLQEKLGLPGIPALDVRQQCTGFIYGLSIADLYIRSGNYKNILLVGGEVHSKGLDKTDRGRDVTVLFGDGAGAAIISRTQINNPTKDCHILSTHLHADGSFAKELWVSAPGMGNGQDLISMAEVEAGEQYPKMNGKVVFMHAVRRMCEVLMEGLKYNNLTIADVDFFAFHQANLRINEKVGQELGIPPEKVFNTIQKYGNTTAATIPIGLYDAALEKKLRPGMLVASAAFGSGFTWASAIFRY
jgi:3-oxoacyl-[acyl-carrier-protein] synthase-3